jgi:hypothetical protein
MYPTVYFREYPPLHSVTADIGDRGSTLPPISLFNDDLLYSAVHHFEWNASESKIGCDLISWLVCIRVRDYRVSFWRPVIVRTRDLLQVRRK